MLRITLRKRLLLGTVCLMALGCVAAQAQSAIMLDTRLMIMAHPMTNQFDPALRRFRNTSSEPLASGETRDGIGQLVKSLERQLGELQAKIGRELQQAAPNRRPALEKAFLSRRRELEARLKEQKERQYTVQEVPLNQGMTTYDSIFPQIQTISNDLQNAVRMLRDRYQSPVVIDISSLLPLYPPQGNMNVLRQNFHFGFWRNSFSGNAPSTLEWMLQAKRYWAYRDSQMHPVPYGARDVRLEAAHLMGGKKVK